MDVNEWIPLLLKSWNELSSSAATFEQKQGRSRRASQYQTRGSGPEFAASQGVKRLSHGFTGNRRLVGSRYLDDPDLLGAYLLYYWPISYMQVRSILNDVAKSGFTMPRRILDLGSGPAPLALAAYDAWQQQKNNSPNSPETNLAATLTCLDHSSAALEIIEKLVNLRTKLQPATPLAGNLWTNVWSPPKSLVHSVGKGEFDLIGFGHVLNEMGAQAKDPVAYRLGLVAEAASLLSEQGMVLILEPALRSTTDAQLALRDRLVAEGFPVYSPCSWSGPCPARATGQVCHQRLAEALPESVKRIANLAGLDKESQSMSVLVIGKKGASWPEKRTWYRTTSEPMLNKAGRTRLMVCGPEGRFGLSAKLQGNGVLVNTSLRNTFAELDRGDRIEVDSPEIRESGWGVGEHTVLKKK